MLGSWTSHEGRSVDAISCLAVGLVMRVTVWMPYHAWQLDLT